MSFKQLLKVDIPITLFVMLLVMQAVPYGRSHANPPITGEPAWDSPQTEALARRACYDCHSNETRWPWYASIAPVSWLVQRHVSDGRSELNFSKFDQPQKEAHESAEKLEEGEMPMWEYIILHPESRLSDVEKRALLRGLQATFGGESNEENELHHDDDEHDDDD